MSILRSKRYLSALASFSLLASISFLYIRTYPSNPAPTKIPTTPPLPISPSWEPVKPLYAYTRHLVMGRLKADDISWLDALPANLTRKIYTVDDPDSMPSVPANKGHEAMAYLTYIIDNYDSLPDTVLFFHPHRSSWHNNILLDLLTARTIERLSDARVARNGYFNTRCHLDPGCPDWLHIDRPAAEWDFVKKLEEQYFTSALWAELHPGAPIPKALSQPCCAQFAVSRAAILAHPLSAYVRWRTWLLNTPLEDAFSGRVFEYTWQYIFTAPNSQSEVCPPQHECYCDGYGVCFENGEAELEAWLGVLHEREEIDGKIQKLKERLPKGTLEEDNWDLGQLGANRREFIRRLGLMKEAAYRRGDDPRVRAAAAGREWKEGDGF